MKFYDVKLWKRKYIDLWTIPHFLIGVIFAFVAIIENFSVFNSFYLLVALAVLWELFEVKYNLTEPFTNRIVDVFASITGFYFAVVLIDYFDPQGDLFRNILYFLMIIYVVSNIIGWLCKHLRDSKGGDNSL
ncbi:MAG TPA: hypothetical protein PKA60_00025 [Candidatus Paceibacterota bacterium]|nr:hypothetical protein [Candidatus Paceibacterota bacterium]